jgi:nucleotidyltransferase substrate binding protein (TIGR01987 family)
MLDLSPLERAYIETPSRARRRRSDLARSHPDLPPLLIAAAIQAFEYTYELSHKMLRRHLQATEPDPASVSAMSFNALIRLGYARGQLDEELAVWMAFREASGATSHAYNEGKAQAVFDAIPRFLEEARFFLGRLSDGDAARA